MPLCYRLVFFFKYADAGGLRMKDIVLAFLIGLRLTSPLLPMYCSGKHMHVYSVRFAEREVPEGPDLLICSGSHSSPFTFLWTCCITRSP